MKVEVLVATMHQNDHSLLQKMNIQTDAVIANQCQRNEYKEIETKFNNIVKIISTKTKGVGINRNFALLYASKDILLFADDDLVYDDNYEGLILQAFNDNPEADMIIFNVKGAGRPITKAHRVRWYNFMRYGTVRIAIKRQSLQKANVWFSSLFGGGAKYSAGEDSLFLRDCLAKKLKIFATPVTLCKLDNSRPSTWFDGYNKKFFYDKGVLYNHISKKLAKLLCIQYLIRHKKARQEMGFFTAYKEMKKGIKA